MKRITLISLACAAIMPSAACTHAILGGAAYTVSEIMNREDINLAAKHYAVADYLIQQASTFIKRGDLIVAEPLTDIQTPEMGTTIAKLIPEQIGVRLSQLGYRIDLGAVTTTPDTNYLRPSLTNGEEAEFVLTGHYLRRRKALDVKVRIVDIRKGTIVAAFDYTIPNDQQIRDLSEPQAKIMKVTPQQ